MSLGLALFVFIAVIACAHFSFASQNRVEAGSFLMPFSIPVSPEFGFQFYQV